MSNLSFKAISPVFGAVVEGFEVDNVPASDGPYSTTRSIVSGCLFFLVLNWPSHSS